MQSAVLADMNSTIMAAKELVIVLDRIPELENSLNEENDTKEVLKPHQCSKCDVS